MRDMTDEEYMALDDRLTKTVPILGPNQEKKNGAVFIRHGSNHDWYKNNETGIAESVPRHQEIKYF